MNSANLYLRLFHGRTSPDEQLFDWGVDGPVIGPVGISCTYGGMKLHSPDWPDFMELPVRCGGLIFYDGVYYGDADVLTADDPCLVVAINEAGAPHDYARFSAWCAALERDERERRIRLTPPPRAITPLPLP